MADNTHTPVEATERALHWQQWNYLRHAIVLAAWLAALKTFSLFYRQGIDRCQRAVEPVLVVDKLLTRCSLSHICF